MIVDLDLVCRKTNDDWYCIERAGHVHSDIPRDGGYPERLDGGQADIEGTAEEMRAIAHAILSNECASFDRCAVDILWPDAPMVTFWSPRNSKEEAQVPRPRARALAEHILDTVPGRSST